MEGTKPITMKNIIKGLASYLFPVNFISKQKRVMRRGMRKLRRLKVKLFSACLIDLNKYLDFFPGAMLSDKIGLTELNEIFLDSITNSWIKQAYVQVFYCESITVKKSDNMFERMEISESIYEGIVEHYYKMY